MTFATRTVMRFCAPSVVEAKPASFVKVLSRIWMVKDKECKVDAGEWTLSKGEGRGVGGEKRRERGGRERT
jgi:hypothetical protein